MKTTLFKILSLVLSTVLIAGGCSKDNTEDGNHQEVPDRELPDNVFDENVTRYFTEVTSSYIRVSSDIPASRLPEEGDVFVCLATGNTPYGYLGRIMSVEETTDGYVWHTGQAALTEAFESLHMDESIDAMAQVEEMVDEDGKSYDFETVDNSVWDEINPVKDKDEDGLEDNAETKAGVGGYADATIRLPLDGIEVGGATLSGSLYISTRINITIDISGWKLQYANLEVTPRVGTDIEFNADISVGDEITLFEHQFPLGAITVGYVVLCPVLNLELVAGFDGEITVKASMKNEFMNMKYFVKYENGAWKKGYDDYTVAEGNRCRAASLEMSGELYTEASAGLTMGLYSADMIGISLDAVGRHSLKGEYSLSDENLFKTDKKVGIERTLHGELTFFTDFLGEAADFEKTVETGNLRLGVTPVSLFPGVFDLVAELQSKVIGVSSSWDTDDNLLSVEYGIVLLDDDYQPIEFRKLGSVPEPVAVRSASVAESISFEVDRASDYIIASFVEHGDTRYLGAEVEVKGKILNPCYQYGKQVQEMISMSGLDNIHWTFEYDEYGRYSKVTEKISGRIYDFKYADKSFSFKCDDDGLYNCTTDDNGYVTSIDFYSDNYHNQVIYTYENGFIVKTEEYANSDDGKPFGLIWTSECEWEEGNLTRGGLSYFMDGDTYSYTEHEDKMSVNIYFIELPFRFKGTSNKNLMQIYDNDISYTYTFDEEGYILSMKSNYDSYIFTYYE